MTTPLNGAQPGLSNTSHPEEYKIAALVFYSCIFIIGLFVNATALWVFSCTTKKRTTVTIYMMNVALLDLIFIMSLPFRMFYYMRGEWPFGEYFCHILGALTVFYPSIALWLFAFISADRYMAIVQPKYAKELKNTGKAVLTCVGIWIMTLTTTTPLLLLYEDPDKASTPPTCLKISDIIHLKAINMLNFTRLIFFFLIPLFIMIGCYLVIIHSLLHGRTSKLKPKVKEKSIRIIITLVVQTPNFQDSQANNYVQRITVNCHRPKLPGTITGRDLQRRLPSTLPYSEFIFFWNQTIVIPYTVRAGHAPHSTYNQCRRLNPRPYFCLVTQGDSCDIKFLLYGEISFFNINSLHFLCD
ncbi:N-arachidonyl glycine receptor isoform X1 [Suricata suricatta]|uniref:N-arachidonyl glycine receptor n=1 Tax=Suricata suricatta TaxID=37032 RepID=A0A673V6G2_SURSU|nr:N-arachidonyl glycine receptor isoform X1 [Suricata suricatta]